MIIQRQKYLDRLMIDRLTRDFSHELGGFICVAILHMV